MGSQNVTPYEGWGRETRPHHLSLGGLQGVTVLFTPFGPFKSLLNFICWPFLARAFWLGRFQCKAPAKPLFPGRVHHFLARAENARAILVPRQKERPFK